jgi:hypothetical protein
LSGTDDLAHGAYFVWRDWRNGESDIYMTRLRSDGSRAPGWTANGNPICLAAGEQRAPRVVTDRTTGAWVIWVDDREGTALYLQRLGSDGRVAAGWPPDGRRVAGLQGLPRAWPDFDGGVVLIWAEPGGGLQRHRRLHLDSSGVPLPSMPSDSGAVVFTQLDEDWGNCSGADEFFQDAHYRWPSRVGVTYVSSYTSCGHIPCGACTGGSSTRLHVIDDSGQVVETNEWPGIYTVVLDDRAGGTLGITRPRNDLKRRGAFGHPSWERLPPVDAITAAWNGDGFHLFGRFPSTAGRFARLDDAGQNVPGWPNGGVPGCVGCAETDDPLFVHDGAGGLLLAWRSTPSTQQRLFANWIRPNGTLGWIPEGTPISRFPNVEIAGFIGNRLGDAIVYWRDARDGEGNLWAYRVSVDAPPTPPTTLKQISETRAVAPAFEFALDAITPNPSPGELAIRFQLPHAGTASITVTDVAGRIAIRRTLDVSAGPHSVELARTSPLAPGVYLVRLEFAGAALTRRAVVVR